ncbi:hypothetical protein K8I28_16005 [bacterium]|nr:hypothetical protein [bacterium]
MFKRLFKTKTFWAAVGVLIMTGERLATGKSTITEALQLAIPAMLTLFVRDGVAKVQVRQELTKPKV